MLRIECYPVMDGIRMRCTGITTQADANGHRDIGQSVERTITSRALDSLGVDEALRDILVDISQEYPALLGYARR